MGPGDVWAGAAGGGTRWETQRIYKALSKAMGGVEVRSWPRGCYCEGLHHLEVDCPGPGVELKLSYSP